MANLLLRGPAEARRAPVRHTLHHHPNPEYTRIENLNDTISLLYLKILLI
jgi:hypothetical protein